LVHERRTSCGNRHDMAVLFQPGHRPFGGFRQIFIRIQQRTVNIKENNTLSLHSSAPLVIFLKITASLPYETPFMSTLTIIPSLTSVLRTPLWSAARPCHLYKYPYSLSLNRSSADLYLRDPACTHSLHLR